MAFTTTMLAWGAVENRDAYAASGQLTHLLNNLRVPNDYFIKAHPVAERPLRAGRQRRRRPQVVGSGRGDADGAARVQDRCQLWRRGAGGGDRGRDGRQLDGLPADRPGVRGHAAHPRQAALHLRRHGPEELPRVHHRRDVVLPVLERLRRTSWSGARSGCTAPPATPAYLAKAEAGYDAQGNENQTSTKMYKWTISWDNKQYGTYVLLAQLTGKQKYRRRRQPVAGLVHRRGQRREGPHLARRHGRRGHLGRAAVRRQHRLRRAGLQRPPRPTRPARPATTTSRSGRSTTRSATTRATPATSSASAPTRRRTRTTAPRTAPGGTASRCPSRPGTCSTARWSAARPRPTTPTPTAAATT